MRDYKFGDFICERRKAVSLSQFQLGRLVGVSDKAVSKWENGTSKPKSSLLPKIAEELNVSIDELLNCKLKEKISSKEDNLSQKEIWEKAQSRLEELYGENAPLRVVSRLKAEKEKLEKTFLPLSYAIIGDIVSASQKEGYDVNCIGAMGNSFLAYLLGAVSLNPLKPHYLCPRCKKAHFMLTYKSAWDLPRRTCDCGADMERLGHDMPLETINSEIRSNYAECKVAQSMMPKVIEILKDFAENTSVVCMLPDTSSTIPSNPYRFFFDPGHKGELRTVEYSEEQIYNLLPRHRLIVQPTSDIDKLHDLYVKTGTSPSEIELNEELFNEFLRLDFKGIRAFDNDVSKEMISKCKPRTFYGLAQILGFGMGTGTWFDVASHLIEEEIPLSELIAFRDDVFVKVADAMSSQGIYDGYDFAYEVMNDARRGFYSIKGMSKKTEESLKELPLPNWFFPSLFKFCYLIPKCTVFYRLKMAIAYMWFKKNYPEDFKKIAL